MPSVFVPQALVLDGRFRILQPLGGGGMGEVYLAEQVSLGRKVAVKVLRQDLSLQPGMAERFLREAKLLSSVEHPSIVRVIDFGQSDGATCLVMEWVQGQTLRQALESGPLEPARAQRLLLQLAEGLAAIHDKGIIHRDLKPENVVLTQTPQGEHARLLDFGIARLAETDPAQSALSQVGLVIGTPEYLSPEQALGAPVVPQSDLYSLGVLGYRMLSGALPFMGPTSRQFLAQHVNETPRSLTELVPHLSPTERLAQVIHWCLQKEVNARPPSASDFTQALRGERALPFEEGSADTKISSTTRHARVRSLWRRLRVFRGDGLPRKRGLFLSVAVLLMTGVWILKRQLAPSVSAQAMTLVQEGRPKEALALLDTTAKASKGGKLPLDCLGVKAFALHTLGNHSEELGTVGVAVQANSATADPVILQGLAEDWSKGRSERLEDLFKSFPRDWIENHLSKLADEPYSPRQWGALQYLELIGGTRRLDLVKVYLGTLTSKNCNVRSVSATRLGELKDEDAVDPLKWLAESPRPKTLGIFVGSCGHDEAADAIKRLSSEK